MTDQAVVARLRQWLLRNPRPNFVRVFSEQFDTPSDIEISGPRPRWADIAADLATMEPTMVQAMDSKGNILRVERVLDDGTAQAPAVEPTAEIQIPQVLSNDPETIRLTHFANLIARCYESAYSGSAKLQSETQSFLLNWASRMEERLDRAEEKRRDAEESLLESKLAETEEDDGGGLRSTIESAFFGGVKQPAATPEAPARGGRVIPGWGEN
jgi:hypothetical protein